MTADNTEAEQQAALQQPCMPATASSDCTHMWWHAVEICSLDSGASPLQQVAVKRLKASSGIGIHDLASEARILAKLHHRWEPAICIKAL